jgi:two-component system sensor histidine kinase BaeS
VTGADGLAIIGRPPEDEPGLRRDLVVDGQRIGLLFLPARPGPLGMVERQFSERRQRLLNFSAILTLTLAAIVALILSRHLLAPVQKLAGATRKLRGGDYKVRVATTGTDELGALAEDFNELASTLEENQRARRRWVADISHELRTPVAVLRAQVDALEDGLQPMDEKAVGALSGEIDRIARLVDDLGTLAQSDSGTLSYEKERVSLRDVLQTPLDMAAPRLRDAGLTLERDLTQIECVTVLADRDRMHQVIANLLDNSIAYTGSGGIVRVSATATTDTATIVFEDLAPGVEPADLPRLFDRLYRVEASRNRRTGGSGLGLSICASIVRAQGGEISAANADIGGLAVSISMPLVPGHSPHSAS